MWYEANHIGIGPTKLLLILYEDLGYENAVELPAFFSLLERDLWKTTSGKIKMSNLTFVVFDDRSRRSMSI